MLLSEEELKKTSVLDPTIAKFMENNPMPPFEWENAAKMKGMMAANSKRAQAMLGSAESSIIEEHKDIPMRDGFASEIKVIRPATAPAAGSPLIIFSYGGGFIGGNYEAGTAFGRAWVRLLGAVVVCISYRLAPEWKYPVPWHDAIDSAKWIAEHAADLGADPKQGFIISGTSAGATLSAVMTLTSIEETFAHPVTGQWLCAPSLMTPDSVPDRYKQYFRSLEHNKDAPLFASAALDELEKHIQFPPDSPLRYPVLNKAVPLSKLPPTFLQTCGLDPVRDDALVYEEMLKEAGVQTRINLYPGCPHMHFNFFPGIDISTRAVADIHMGMGWLLGKNISPAQALAALKPSE